MAASNMVYPKWYPSWREHDDQLIHGILVDKDLQNRIERSLEQPPKKTQKYSPK